ncbi:ATP-binding cassette domain-containing protein [Caldicellulosiruptoraceae bacterium PP1]
MERLLSLINVTKYYNNSLILDNINLTVYKGEVISILGPNGTGKSTLLRIIGGLTNISQGKREISYTEKDFKIRYIPEGFAKLNFTPLEYLILMGRISNINYDVLIQRINHLFYIFNFDFLKNTPIKNLSKGSAQKVLIMQALLDTPDLLLLDEPLSGLDEKSQKELIRIIYSLKEKMVTIILVCHEIELANMLSDRIFELNKGKLTQIEGLSEDNKKNTELVEITINASMGINFGKLNDYIFRLIESENTTRVIVEKSKLNRVLYLLIEQNCEIIKVGKYSL